MMYFNTVAPQNLTTSLLCLLLHRSLWLKYWLWYNRERTESFCWSVCAILQDTQNGQIQWQLQKSFRLPGLLFFPLEYPELYLTLHYKRWSESTLPEVVRRKPTPVHVPPASVGAGREPEAPWPGSQEVPGSPPGRSNSQALQDELGASCPRSLCYPSATLFRHPHPAQLPCLEDENKISSYLHSVLSSSNATSNIV